MSGGDGRHGRYGGGESSSHRQESPDRGCQRRSPKAGPEPPLLAEEFATDGSIPGLRYGIVG